MNLRISLLALVMALTIGATGQVHAQAFDVTFTLIGDPSLGDDGTVTGTILGLSEASPGDDTSYFPTSLRIESGPGVITPFTLGFSPSFMVGTGFTIIGNVVTDANLSQAFFGGDGGATFNQYFDPIPSANNVEYFAGDFTNDGGFAGVTYGLATPSAVPEPSQYGLGIFLALAAFTGWRRFSARQAA